jgi:hypothetical protein
MGSMSLGQEKASLASLGPAEKLAEKVTRRDTPEGFDEGFLDMARGILLNDFKFRRGDSLREKATAQSID